MAKLLSGTRIYGTANVDTQINVGANAVVNTSALFLGNSTVNATITSSSIITQGTIAAGNASITGFLNVSSTANVGGVISARSDLVVNGAVTIANTLATGNTTVTGWINVSSTANIGGVITARSDVTVNGALTVANNTTITGFINVASTANVGGAINARSTLTVNGALTVANTAALGNTTITGDATVTGNLTANNVRTTGSVQIDGNLTVSGNTITIGVTNLAVSDNIIYLNEPEVVTVTSATSNGTAYVYTANNGYSVGQVVTVTGMTPSGYNIVANTITFANTTAFAVANTSAPGAYVSGGSAVARVDANPDVGFAANYNDGTYRHAGFFRDATDGVFKVFDQYQPEPSGAFIDTSNNTFRIADFQSNNTVLGTANVAGAGRVGTGLANYLEMLGGATTVWPSIAVKGTDTNIGIAATTKGTGGYTFGTNGNYTVQFAVTHTASAVNYLQATGAAAGSGPALSAQGSDTNINFNYYTKGTGSHNFNSGNGTQFSVYDNGTASIVNSWSARGSATGAGALLYAQGTDTDVGGFISSKGAGAITFRSHGNVSTQFNISATTSAVNYLQATGAATTNAPTLSAQGSDSNIGISVQGKGTGYPVIYTVASVGGTATNTQTLADIKGAAGGNVEQLRTSLVRHTTGSDWTGVALRFGQVVDITSMSYIDFNPVGQVQGVAVQVTNGSPFQVKTSGGEQFRVSDTSSAVNYLQVTGAATGSGPVISSQGSDAAINLSLTSKAGGDLLLQTGGSGGYVVLRPNSISTLRAVTTTSGVNYFQMAAGATGAGPIVSAIGTDTNIDINYTTKGTGNHKFNSGFGTEFLVYSFGSTVANYWSAVGTATGASPYLFAQGSDTNVDGKFTAKGSGSLRSYTNGGSDEQFRVAHTANAVNLIQVNGANTGNSPTIFFNGNDTNISGVISTKGAGGLSIYTNSNSQRQLRVIHTASAVNFLDITGAATGGAPSIVASAGSSDANVGITFAGKGTGTINLNSNTTFNANVMTFTGSNTAINLRVVQDGTLSFEGGAGQLFSISNNMTGQIFAVNDISGIPSIEVYSNGQVNIAKLGGNVSIGTSTSTTTVNGAVAFANAVTFSNTITANGALNITAGANAIVLSNASAAYINFGAGGYAAPTTTTRSTGTKVILFDQLSSTAVDYALGVEGNYMWFSTPATTTGFKWYSNTTNIMVANSTVLTVNAGANISANVWIGGSATIAGNLTVSGTTTYINTTNLNVGDNIITLNADLGAVAPSENAGIEVNRGTSTNTSLYWDETNKRWTADVGNSSNSMFALLSNTYVRTIYTDVNSGLFERWGTPAAPSSLGEFSISGGVTKFDTKNRDYLIANGSVNTAIFAANGNIGFGNTTPNVKFIVQGTTGTTAQIQTDSSSTVITGHDAAFNIYNRNTANGTYNNITFKGSSNVTADITAKYVDQPNSYGDLYFNTRAADGYIARMSIRSGEVYVSNSTTTTAFFGANGNIGVGTTTPFAPINIYTNVNSNNPTAVLQNLSTGSSAQAMLSIRGDTSTTQLDIGVSSNTYGGYGLAVANGAYILSKSVNGLGIFADNAASYIRFGAGGTTEGMRLNANGGLYVGTTGDLYGRQWSGLFNKNQNATTQIGVVNSNTGAAAEARFSLITGTGNSYVDWGLVDAAGVPTSTMGYGSAVGIFKITLTNTNGSFKVGNTSTTALHVSTSNGNVGIGNSAPVDKLRVEGTVSHLGLVPSTGTNIDQIYTATPSLTLNTTWQSTGVTATNLANGTYIVQMLANDVAAGGTANNEYYSGIMSWYSADVNSTVIDEIPLHRAGVTGSNNSIFLATQRTPTANTSDLILMISSAANNSSSSTYTLKFRRMI